MYQPSTSKSSIFPLGDLDKFSMARWIYALKEHRTTGQNPARLAPYETSYYRGLEELTHSADPQIRAKAQGELNTQDGGALAPEEWRKQFMSIIRDEGELRTAGVQYYATDYRVSNVPVGTSEWTFTYGLENQSITEVTRKFAQRTATMKAGKAFSKLSNELVRDAADIADQFLQRDGAAAVAFETDKKTLEGTGQAGTPVGLLNTTNVPSTALAAVPTPAQLTTGIFNAKNLNGSTNVPLGSTSNVHVVSAPHLELSVRAQVNATNQGSIPWLFGLGTDPIQKFLGVGWILTNAVATNANSGVNIYYGDFRHLAVIQRTDFDFMMSDQPDFANNQSDVRIIFRYDILVLHPEAFFCHTDAR